jgi:hypothetical protein
MLFCIGEFFGDTNPELDDYISKRKIGKHKLISFKHKLKIVS